MFINIEGKYGETHVFIQFSGWAFQYFHWWGHTTLEPLWAKSLYGFWIGLGRCERSDINEGLWVARIRINGVLKFHGYHHRFYPSLRLLLLLLRWGGWNNKNSGSIYGNMYGLLQLLFYFAGKFAVMGGCVRQQKWRIICHFFLLGWSALSKNYVFCREGQIWSDAIRYGKWRLV